MPETDPNESKDPKSTYKTLIKQFCKENKGPIGKASDIGVLATVTSGAVTALQTPIDIRQFNKYKMTRLAMLASFIRAFPTNMTSGTTRSTVQQVSNSQIRSTEDPSSTTAAVWGFGIADAFVSHYGKMPGRLAVMYDQSGKALLEGSKWTWHNLVKVYPKGLTPAIGNSVINLALLTRGTDYIKKTISEHLGGSPMFNTAIGSIVSGTIASVVTLPFDTLKNEAVRSAKKDPKTDKLILKSTWNIVKECAEYTRKEGIIDSLSFALKYMCRNDLGPGIARTVTAFLAINGVCELLGTKPITQRFADFFSDDDDITPPSNNNP